MKRKSLALACAVSSVLTVAAFTASAAETPISEDTVVVTGSYIRGTPEDTALPVDVVTAEDLQQQGSPSMVQLVKTLSATSGGAVGESNRFLGTTAGSATVNLRGFGAGRTLVLMNGRRMATVPTATALAGAVDINLIPTAALGSIEVLKDGAAATYGSDAVAGVVNFITRRDLDGVEVGGQYSDIRDSDGDYNANLNWGKKLDNGNVLITAGYRRRSELKASDNDWAVQPFANNPVGGWSTASNPGVYVTGTAAQLANGTFSTAPTAAFVDDGCTQMGGIQVPATTTPGFCRFQYSNFDNLVDDERHYQVYGELNLNLSENLKLHGEMLWARHEVPDERVSPAQSTVQFPTPVAASGGSLGGGTSPYPASGLNQQSRFYIPFANPGLQQYYATHCPGGSLAGMCGNLPNGVITSQTQWRPEGWGGNPLFADGADHQERTTNAYRASVGLNGTFAKDIGWDATVTFMQDDLYQNTPDIVVNRMELAMRGLGGPNCNPATGTPGAGGCLWFNPFSSAIQKSAVTGIANPFYNAATANSREVLDWMHQYIRSHGTSQMGTFDLVFNGSFPFQLWGDNLRWAVGSQYRREVQQQTTNDLANITLSPCVDSADDGSPGCSGGIGPYTFYNGLPQYDLSRNVEAVFAEFDVPVTDSLSFNLAGRYEKYPGAIGSTTNPKIAMKWQILNWVALRGSWGTTFRAPSILTTAPGANRILAQFPSGLYRPVNVVNNPNLEPETADTYNVGLIFKAAGFSGSVDYYDFKFKKELTTETAVDVYRTMFPATGGDHCTNTVLLARFTFAGGVCSQANFLGIQTNQINGPDVDTAGIDFQASYAFNGVLGGDLTLGFDGNHLLKYERGAVFSVEGLQIAAPIDRAGQAELLSAFYSYPKWRGNVFANYAFGEHNFRADMHYIGGTIDRNHDKDPSAVVRLGGINPYRQVDLTWRWAMQSMTTLTLAVQNVADNKPSFAFSQYNYDYTNGNPLGRVFMVAVKQQF